MSGLLETGRHATTFRVEKWDLDQVRWTARKLELHPAIEPSAMHFRAARVAPFGVYEIPDCNLITNAGWVKVMGGLAGTPPTQFVNATTGRIGLGVSGTAVTAADTALGSIGALTSHNWNVINAVPTIGSGTGSGNGLILAATFPTGDANGVAIAEFGVDLGTAATLSTAAVGGLFSHGLATPGTKTSAQTWAITVAYVWT